jgi:hypothetical protein
VPGYWAYSDVGYYWVPGTWVQPPEPGLLWTPGYWAYDDSGVYAWNAGYWAPQVGFYGGVNYGYGYTGNGYQGGYWQQNHFYYNRNVNNFGGTHITNVYERNVTNVTVNRISFNGGNGGIAARPTPQEMSYRSQHHYDPTAEQRQQEHLAAGNRESWASQNHGVPTIAATPRPADFTAHGIVAAHNAPVNIPAVPHNAGPEHAVNAMTPQHQDQPRPMQGEAPRPENAMTAQHPEAMQRPETVQRPEAMQRPSEAPVAHEAPQVVHPPEAPVLHEPAQQAFHPQEIQPARPEATRPEPIPVSRPQEMRPPVEHAPAPRPEAPHPNGGGQRPDEHKPN